MGIFFFFDEQGAYIFDVDNVNGFVSISEVHRKNGTIDY